MTYELLLDLLRPVNGNTFHLYAMDARAEKEQRIAGGELGLDFTLTDGQICTPSQPLVIRHSEPGLYTFRYLTEEGEQQALAVEECATFHADDPPPRLATGDLLLFPAATRFERQYKHFGKINIIIDGHAYEPWKIPAEGITLARIVDSVWDGLHTGCTP